MGNTWKDKKWQKKDEWYGEYDQYDKEKQKKKSKKKQFK